MDFHWAVEYEIATGSLPANENDVKVLQREGIKAVLSLHKPHFKIVSLMKDAGMEHVSAELTDFSTPGIELMDELAELIDKWRQEKKPVYIHCYMGIGRCRTVACSYIATRITDAEHAFFWTGPPETAAQRQFVVDYAKRKHKI